MAAAVDELSAAQIVQHSWPICAACEQAVQATSKRKHIYILISVPKLDAYEHLKRCGRSSLVVGLRVRIRLTLVLWHARIASHCEWATETITAVEVAPSDLTKQAHQA